MVCRIAGYIGKPPSEIYDLPASDVDLLSRYYLEQPFGSDRDNWHMAVLAKLYADSKRERGQPAFSVSDFIWKTAEQIREEQTRKTIAAMETLGKKKHGN